MVFRGETLLPGRQKAEMGRFHISYWVGGILVLPEMNSRCDVSADLMHQTHLEEAVNKAK